MARPLRFAILIACILFAGRAFAAGGACPSGANYTNPTNPNGAAVTLASLGITNCYYVAAGGSDSNSGTSESSPWLHSPGMANCSANCAAVALSAGIGVIFRGGDTWHFGNSGATPYAGVVTTCANNGDNAAGLCLDDINATTGNPIYYGVDKTWFTGGSWARPILTADNSLCNSGTRGTLPDGATCTGTTDSYGQPSYYVSSCPYQIGNSNNLVDVGFSKYVIADNFELTGLCLNHVGQPGGYDSYFNYSGAQAPIYLTNNYIHGASHLRYAAPNGQPGCTGSTVCISLNAFYGSVNNGSVGETVTFNVVDFSDSDPVGENLCQCGFYNVSYNAFRYTTQALPQTLHTFHDNLYEYFFENGHSNLIESKESSNAAIYNNLFRHVENLLSSGGGVFLWFGPQTGVTDYVFDNVAYDIGALEYFNMGGVGLTTNNGNYTIFNNTFQTNVNQPILRCGPPTGTVLDTNNHYVDDGSSYILSCNPTTTTSLLMTNAKATSDGYTSSQTYSYSPASSGSPTVGAGTNEQSSYCNTLSGSSDSLIQAAGTACQSDTTYACTYNSTAHAISCPARTIVARSTSWGVGAYQSYGVKAGTPTPPSNLTAAVQ
jgi:hypothetical protein